MPYIEKQHRERLDASRFGKLPMTAGELNYQITRACDSYLQRMSVNYTNLNAVVGVLECAKLEFYRRIAAQYEDSKIQQNGDVYESRQK